MLGYACFFYIFAAMVVSWQDALGWDGATLALGPTIAILISAALAPFAGRAVDRGYGPRLMVGGAAAGAVSLAMLAVASRQEVYLLAWAGLGVAQASCLYEVCFALLIRRFGLAARAAITQVTLVAGLASTLAFPAAAALTLAVGWQGTVWVAVAVAGLIVLPLHLVGARTLARGPADGRLETPAAAAGRPVLRDGNFWRLAALFSLLNLNHWMLISFMLPVFAAQGLGAQLAVAAAACVGPAQVAGRLALMRSDARLGTVRATRLTLGAIVLAALLLAAAGAAPLLAFGFAAVQGAAMGVMTILRPMMVADRLGSQTYGATAGMMSIPTLLSSAAAPLLGALLLGAGGVGLLIGVALILALIAFGLALTAGAQAQ
jgi:predicted MFS family arabinose efflux permease